MCILKSQSLAFGWSYIKNKNPHRQLSSSGWYFSFKKMVRFSLIRLELGLVSFFSVLCIVVFNGLCFSFHDCIYFTANKSLFPFPANSSAAGAGVIFFLTFVPYFFILPRYNSLSHTEKMISCLLPNIAIALGSIVLTVSEASGKNYCNSTS